MRYPRIKSPPRRSPERKSPNRSPERKSPNRSPRRSPNKSTRRSPLMSSRGLPKRSPRRSPKRKSPNRSPRKSPRMSSKGSPKGSPRRSPKGSPRMSPKGSPNRSPSIENKRLYFDKNILLFYSNGRKKSVSIWLEGIIDTYVTKYQRMFKILNKKEQKVVKGYIKDCTEELIQLKMKDLNNYISMSKMELLGISALYVVMKFIAGYDWIYDNISPSFFSDMSGGQKTRQEIVAVERDLLKTTNWQLCPTITAILENETMPFLV